MEIASEKDDSKSGSMSDEEISIAAYNIFIMRNEIDSLMTSTEESDFAESLFDDDYSSY